MVSCRARTPRLAGLVALVTTALIGVTTVSVTNQPVEAAEVGDQPVMTMYVPLAEQEISDGLFSIYPAGAAGAADIVSTIAITSAADDSLIYWDHWEDGYETELSAPTSPTTQVWGDEDLSNGAAPGITDAADDVVDLGTVIFLQDTVELPRSNTQIFYDGGDKVAASRGISMSRAGWDTGLGSAHAGAVAVADTSRFGMAFDVPIGEDAGFGAFNYTGMGVQVTADSTTINVDLGGDGTIDQTVVRDEGESFFVDGGVTVGTVVTTTSPAQVHLITGRVDSRYEGRWYEVFPAETLADEYVAAAGSFSTTQVVTIFLYNPNDDAIDVAATTTVETTTVAVPARSVVAFDLPNGSGGRFSSPGNKFSAASGTVAVTGTTQAYDWGYSLVPTSLLTPTVFVGWGAGNPDNTASNSPVWVAPLADTTVFIDRDADGTADESVLASAFTSIRVVDPDHDLTGARIFTTDGTLLSVAWGQDAAIQPSDAFDLGTAILPTAALITSKSAELTNDVNDDGLVDPGDELTYTIWMFDAGAQSLTTVLVEDVLSSSLEYVAGSTSYNGAPVPDSATGTLNPLDEIGLAVDDLDPGGLSAVSFRARVAATFPFGADSVANTVTVTTDQTSSTSTVITAVTPIFAATISGHVWRDLDADATQDADESGLDAVTVSIVGPSHPAGTTTTTTDGAFSFGDLLPGEYTIAVERAGSTPLPTSAYSSTGGDTRQVVIASGQIADGNDFGYVLPASISGSVYNDVDVDDTLDVGEGAFAAVEVTIIGPGLPPAGRTQLTTASGAFVFSNLSAGTFNITAAASTGDLPGHFVPSAAAPRVVAVTADEHAIDNNIGLYNPLPTAVPDEYATELGRALTITDPAFGVLANDEPGNAPATVVAFDTTTAAAGTVTVAADGTFVYAPATNFTGVDSFEYTLADANGDESTARVTIAVESPASIVGTVWNDRDADGRIDADEPPLDGVVVERRDCAGALRGTARTDASGRFTFDGQAPGCHQLGVDLASLPADVTTSTFDRDGNFDASAQVVISGGTGVTDANFGFVNLVPDAGADQVTTNEGESVTFDPLANDVDPEGRPLAITFVAASGGGTTTLNRSTLSISTSNSAPSNSATLNSAPFVSATANSIATTNGATITYTPAPGFDGLDTVVYTVCDPALECSTAAVAVTVINTNDPPRLRSGGTTVEIILGQQIPALDVVDDEGDSFTVTLASGSLPAGVTLNADGSFSGIPTASRTSAGSVHSFSVELCDARGACATVSYTMTVRAATGSGSGGGSIPNSGSDSMRLLPNALALLLIGGLLTFASRQRHESQANAS